jgi:hypothetical protein
LLRGRIAISEAQAARLPEAITVLRGIPLEHTGVYFARLLTRIRAGSSCDKAMQTAICWDDPDPVDWLQTPVPIRPRVRSRFEIIG